MPLRRFILIALLACANFSTLSRRNNRKLISTKSSRRRSERTTWLGA